MNHSSKKHIYIIAGPNGAGKTTFARKFLPYYAKCKRFINADLIATGLSPFNPEKQALRAGRLLLEEIDRAVESGIDFAFETTLSGKAYFSKLKKLRSTGYVLHLFFLWIPDIKLSLERIAERVRRGGYDIPEKVVRRRFYKGLAHFFGPYQEILNSWFLFDNSHVTPLLIARKIDRDLHLVREDLYGKILEIAKKEGV